MKIVDMHCDTISKLWEEKNAGKEAFLYENQGHLDLVRMKKSSYLLQNFALFVNMGSCEDPWNMVWQLYEVYQEELQKNRNMIAPMLRYEDIAENEAAGKISALLTVEEGGVCRGDIEKLRELYRMGVRMLTLTWNYPNELGFPNLDSAQGKVAWGACREVREMMQRNLPEEEIRQKKKQAEKIFEAFFFTPNTVGGLTENGREFVVEMEQLGMIPDVSHLSDAGFYDVLEITKKPFVASHSNARSLCKCVRNLSDDMIRKLAERGGCMGLNFCADFLKEPVIGVPNPGDMEDIVRHAHYITDLGGMEVLGLGSDFDGIDTNEGIPGAHGMETLWDALHRSGYRESELDKIFYGNVLRVYQEIL